MKKYILFDLDGTLTDPGVGITNSVAYALDRYKITDYKKEDLFKFIGPPLKESFMTFYDFPEKQAIEAIDVYREYFRSKGIFENEVYPNVLETLSELKKRGFKLLVASSKPEEFVKIILEHFDLSEYFDFVGGATMDEQTRITKSAVIAWVLENMKITDMSQCLMVGDRLHDIEGAKSFGMESVGCAFGYGGEEELKNAGADHIIYSFEEILNIV